MSKKLITSVGTTDPIRGFHDGPLLHIARVYRPEKIILIFSEEMLSKKDRILRALESIEGYEPEVIIDEMILRNDEVYLFDKMFNDISKIVEKHMEDDAEIILNLSSATPQIISAMFAINRINDYNVKAVQVATPTHSSNENIKYENAEDIDLLIEMNEDNREDFESRVIEDTSEKFNQALLNRNLRHLINKFDYQAARDIVQTSKNLNNRKVLLRSLEGIVNNIQTQSIPADIARSKLKPNEKKALNAFLLIDLQQKRGNIAECLIRIKSLMEFIIEDFLNARYPLVIEYEDGKPYPSVEIALYLADILNRNNKPYFRNILNLPAYIDILKKYNETSILSAANSVIEINKTRNRVAHSLEEFDSKEIKKLNKAIRSVKDLLKYVYNIENSHFDYYESLNRELITLLK